MKFSKYNLLIPNNDGSTILFNTLSGSTFTLDPQSENAIIENLPDTLDSQNYKLFKDYGALVEENVDESKIYSYYYNSSRFSTSVTTATILLTQACNFRCTYCYEGAGETISSTMSNQTAQAVAKFLIANSEKQRGNIISIVLFGGEPLLNIEKGFLILEELKKYSDNNDKTLVCQMVTNGSLLTEEIVQKLLNYNCKMIQITLDGMPDIHNQRRVAKSGAGTFEQVMDGINLVDKYGDKLASVIRINVDKSNINCISEVMRLLRDAGIQKSIIDFGIVRKTTNACSSYTSTCYDDSELGTLLDTLWKEAVDLGFAKYPRPSHKWIFCGLFQDINYTIDPVGNVYKCWEMVGDESHCIGSIDVKGNFKTSFPFFDWMAIDPLKNEDCAACKYLPTCGGGCIMVSLNQSGTYHSKGCCKIKGVIEKQVINFVLSKKK